ncbi:MAG: TVP38/TMEM64 family protein [Clostridia bacterium]|nr:TVP38/TMEM64 family protein [Clostridia bacterium]
MKKNKLFIFIPIALIFITAFALIYTNKSILYEQIIRIKDIVYNLSIRTQEYIKSFGSFAVFIFITIFSIRTFLIIFPYSVMVILGGNVFGPVQGFIYSLIGVFISSTLAFYLSRSLGKEFVQKLLKNKMQKLDVNIEKHGFKVILFMRLSAVFPYDILSYTAGLTHIKYKHFVLGTVLGVASETFSLSYLGNNIKHPFSWNFIIAIILVIITIVLPILYNRCTKNKRLSKQKAP